MIKIDSAPINPSDLAFLMGHYSSGKPFPTVPGFEGSGTVVLSGYEFYIYINIYFLNYLYLNFFLKIYTVVEYWDGILLGNV